MRFSSSLQLSLPISSWRFGPANILPIYLAVCTYFADSVTRFGEISPLWQNILRLWQIFDAFI